MAEPEARVPQISDSRETYVRWTPIGALPESHVSEIETRSFGEGQLSLILRYGPPRNSTSGWIFAPSRSPN